MPRIVLESWELDNGRVHHNQVVTIRKGDNNHLRLQGQPLVIGFEKLFLRAPSTPRETDISLDDPILREIAMEVWEEQGF